MSTTSELDQETTVIEDPAEAHAELQAEVDRLLAFRREWVRDDDMTPCPACTILVRISDNHCVHCNTDISPNNALVRESVRRLDELGIGIDENHGGHLGTHPRPKSPSLGQRLKNMLTGKPAPTPTPVPSTTCEGVRLLSGIRAGDSLTVIETCGPWHRVQLANGSSGWIFSTLSDDS